MPPSDFRMSLLGTPRITRSSNGEPIDVPLGKPFAALAYLALATERVTRDDLVHLLWPSTMGGRGRASVRQALWLLRKQIHPEVVVEADGALSVNPEILSHDLSDLGTRIAEGRLEEAWRAWRGGPLRGLAVPDAPGWDAWADEVRTRWERRLGEALEAAADVAEGEERLTWLDRALEVRPFREAVHQARTRILLSLRREDEAEEALHRLRTMVDSPDPESLQELEDALRTLRREVGGDEARLTLEFVGRSRELAALSGLWRSVMSGRPRLVSLHGPAGIGKSRLAAEVLRRTALDGAVVAEAAALEVERSLSLGVVAALVRSLLDLPGAAGISAGSTDALHALLPSKRTGRAPIPHPGSPTALADALVDLIEAVAHEAPVVLLIEDVQWSDPASRTLLSRALRSIRGARVLMIWTCRTEEGDAATLREIHALEAARTAEVLQLGPLSLGEMREMITLLLERATADGIERLASAIHDASGGNPLHAVELVHSLRDEEVLIREPGNGWVVDEDRIPSALELPPSVRHALARRLALLSPEALTLARELASVERPQAPRAVMAASSRAGTEASDALQELLQRDVLRWTRDDRVDFAHGAIREAVTPVDPPASTRGRWIAAAVAVAALLVTGVVAHRTSASTGPLPFGGGTLWLVSGRRVYHGYRVARGDPSSWRATDSVALPVGFVPEAAPVLDGKGNWWFGGHSSLDPEAAPDALVFHEGQVDTLLDNAGDSGVRAFEPNLEGAVLGMQSPDAVRYRKVMVIKDFESGASRIIAEGETTVSGRDWSADGSLILGEVDAQWDTVVVLRPDGRRVATMPAPDAILDRLWFCGTRGVVGTSLPPGDLSRTWYWELKTGKVDEVPLVHPHAKSLACSPDGRAIAYLSENRTVVVQSLGGSLISSISSPSPLSDVNWSPDPAPAPAEVSIEAADTILPRGARARLAARVLDARGNSMTVPVEWSSDDPAVASVASDGRVWANRSGEVTLRGTVNGWITDSVRIRVTETESRGLLLSDSFSDLDEGRWVVLGSPKPIPATDEAGRPVLDMRGDGRARDGLLSREETALPRGGTVEIRFRLPLTDRVDRQSITICLLQASPGEPEEIMTAWTITSRWCSRWPARELTDFDPAKVTLSGSAGVLGPVDAGDHLNPDGWNRFALQLRADGIVSLFINDHFVASHPKPVNNAPGSKWRILILDRAADTHVYLRDVALWDEARYPVPEHAPADSLGAR